MSLRVIVNNRPACEITREISMTVRGAVMRACENMSVPLSSEHAGDVVLLAGQTTRWEAIIPREQENGEIRIETDAYRARRATRAAGPSHQFFRRSGDRGP